MGSDVLHILKIPSFLQVYPPSVEDIFTKIEHFLCHKRQWNWRNLRFSLILELKKYLRRAVCSGGRERRAFPPPPPSQSVLATIMTGSRGWVRTESQVGGGGGGGLRNFDILIFIFSYWPLLNTQYQMSGHGTLTNRNLQVYLVYLNFNIYFLKEELISFRAIKVDFSRDFK